MVQCLYRLVVEGHLRPEVREAFSSLDASALADGTALTGRMDQATLLDYLHRVTSLDLVLRTVECLDAAGASG